jgi:hypothetical protein
MSFEDNNENTSDTLSDLMSKSKRKIIIAGDMSKHYDDWMDLLCKDCESSLVIVQMNENNTKIKIICSNCKGESEIGVNND